METTHTSRPSHALGCSARDCGWEDCPRCILNNAAPELLEAAKIISGWADRISEEVTMGPGDNKVLKKLRAAVARAEGGK